jgi:hypothetical protein
VRRGGEGWVEVRMLQGGFGEEDGTAVALRGIPHTWSADGSPQKPWRVQLEACSGRESWRTCPSKIFGPGVELSSSCRY